MTEDKDRAEFEAAYPTVPWIKEPTELNTRQMAFSRGWKAAKESSRKELEALSICELATINPSVKEYAEHWEGRTLKAEKELEAAKQRIAMLKWSRDLFVTEMSAAKAAGFETAQDLFTSYQALEKTAGAESLSNAGLCGKP